jgi:hypothetical protein
VCNISKTPWDINNGDCAEFADYIVDTLKEVKDPICNVYALEFGMLLTRDDDGYSTGFFPPSVEHFGIKLGKSVTSEKLLNCLMANFDESHNWIALETEKGVLHFDAECTEGVDDPLELPTFKKFLVAIDQGNDLNNEVQMEIFLSNWKMESDKNFLKTKAATDSGFCI